jgi:hypothetical protein
VGMKQCVSVVSCISNVGVKQGVSVVSYVL